MDPVEVREERVATGAPPVPPAVAYGTAPAYGSYSIRSVYPVAYRAIQLVWFVVGVINAILALDFAFRLLKANATGFVDFIYGLAYPLASPFDGIFRDTISRSSLVVRWGDLLAIAIYSLIAWGITRLIRIMAAGRGSSATTVAPPPPRAY